MWIFHTKVNRLAAYPAHSLGCIDFLFVALECKTVCTIMIRPAALFWHPASPPVKWYKKRAATV